MVVFSGGCFNIYTSWFHLVLFNFLIVFSCVECYVADEIITSRAGVRIRIGNTDAEGRMVMADVLCHMKEKVRVIASMKSFTQNKSVS